MDESRPPRMRIVVIGGAGNFGARIVRALRSDPNIELLVAGRRMISVPDAEDVPGVSSEVSCGELGRESDKEMMPTEWQRAIECRVATELRTGTPNPRSRSFRKSCAEIIQGLLLLQRSPAIIWLLDTPSRSAQLPNAPHASSAQHAS